MKELHVRAITGAILVAVMLAATYASLWSFIGMIALIGAFCTRELLRMARSSSDWFIWPSALMSGGFIMATGIMLWGGFSDKMQLIIVAGFVLIGVIGALFTPQYFSSRLIGLGFMSFLYIGYSLSCFVQLGFMSGRYDFVVPMGVMGLVWTNDTFAYLTGKAIGRTKLLERISPNKTWEGTAGGFAATFLVAIAISQYARTSMDLTDWAIVGVCTSIFATLGDLVQSMFKREFGVKDSGRILPGHGGFYDRFDGLILVGPAAYWALTLFYFLR